jgi:3',5'-cyclic AMP phosphodiesterase CpdA
MRLHSTRITAGVIGAGLIAALAQSVERASVDLPNKPDSVKFAVIGDNGTGGREQYEVGEQMAEARREFPYDLVLMLGDNFYGSQRPADLVKKFELPYKPLLDSGVRFQAAIGNHDEPASVDYPPLNMGGRRYYTFARRNVRFFVLDTNALDPPQLRWLETELKAAPETWKISYFHHPLYSNAARHGDAVDIRLLVEPLLLEYGVSVVFSGHDHAYERLKPQRGIHYFVCGAGGQLRKGDLKRSEDTAAGFDQDRSFMLVEISDDELFFQVVTRTGLTVDSGLIRRPMTRIGT